MSNIREELHAPGVRFGEWRVASGEWLFLLTTCYSPPTTRFLDEHRHAAVDGLGQLGIAAGARDGRRARVGVEQPKVLRRKRKAALGVSKVGGLVAEKGEFGGW